eukprot:gnl/MRDRNA2_/MRDRNA2_31083_c0_seq1.p1 gnl/MRDRNA2_/MRDRNA2_31083_c0~~gnl/MRDRNA2_/MRDRNA2_31083_c0_seq1.p1  ORF type:complete len:152 (+),score=23.35 gnl/MRDRNA2_/MRDRNA2_31083_c0_seq1:126-581(+)
MVSRTMKSLRKVACVAALFVCASMMAGCGGGVVDGNSARTDKTGEVCILTHTRDGKVWEGRLHCKIGGEMPRDCILPHPDAMTCPEGLKPDTDYAQWGPVVCALEEGDKLELLCERDPNHPKWKKSLLAKHRVQTFADWDETKLAPEVVIR